MTYPMALQHILENFDMYDFDSNEEWKEYVFSHFRYSEGLEESVTFNRMLDDAWLEEFGSLLANPDSVSISEEIPVNPANEVEVYDSRDSAPRVIENVKVVIPRDMRQPAKLVLPQKYKSEQYRPTLEQQVLEKKKLEGIPYTSIRKERNSAVFLDRFKRTILTVFRIGSKRNAR